MAFITVYFPGKIIAHVNVNWLSPVKVRTTLIGGRDKMLVWNDLEADEKIKVYDKGVHITSGEGVYDLLVSYRSGDVWAPKVRADRGAEGRAGLLPRLHPQRPDADQRRRRPDCASSGCSRRRPSLKERGRIVASKRRGWHAERLHAVRPCTPTCTVSLDTARSSETRYALAAGRRGSDCSADRVRGLLPLPATFAAFESADALVGGGGTSRSARRSCYGRWPGSAASPRAATASRDAVDAGPRTGSREPAVRSGGRRRPTCARSAIRRRSAASNG